MPSACPDQSFANNVPVNNGFANGKSLLHVLINHFHNVRVLKPAICHQSFANVVTVFAGNNGFANGKSLRMKFVMRPVSRVVYCIVLNGHV